MVYPNPQIYHDLKAMFVHVPKAAGTSIENTLLKYDSLSICGGHTTAVGYRRAYPDHFETYYKFSVVRHPVDRFLSAYSYLISRPINEGLANRVVHECGDIQSFIDKALSDPAVLDRIVHFLPQKKFICDGDGRILVDSVFRFEKLDEAWLEISTRLGFDYQPLLKLNPSPRLDDRDGLAARIHDLMQRVYRDDFSIFQYEFDSHH
ncbi:Sulfotransferase family protein [Prosthecobacter debontii]|uniref:Sulfotransferase family protein n=1 Tax=Prosthecobacter debontii TaxID=48467 RepID=A0A1T4WKN2_9BACT|nr:sulfotransferase family 2 domain-containing protein [Prosthecobacter debontii]SKA77201.1 Sulfotransferase family protein [Prosthecobacter debontii]